MSGRTTSIASLAIFCPLTFLVPIQAAGQTQKPTTYTWIAEYVAADQNAKAITVKARIPDYISKDMNRFKTGDRVMLIWNMLPQRQDVTAENRTAPTGNTANAEKASSADAKTPSSGGTPQAPASSPPVVQKTESDSLIFIDSYDTMKKSKVETGYILPAEFVSAEAKMVTVRLRVPDTALQAVAAMQPGTWLRATSPMLQPTEVAAVSAVTVVNVGTTSTR